MQFLPSGRPQTLVFDGDFHTLGLNSREPTLRWLQVRLGWLKMVKNAGF